MEGLGGARVGSRGCTFPLCAATVRRLSRERQALARAGGEALSRPGGRCPHARGPDCDAAAPGWREDEERELHQGGDRRGARGTGAVRAETRVRLARMASSLKERLRRLLLPAH